MVTDSLRYWVTETHVDGFRFDLGTILAREPNGFDYQSGFLKACSQDPVLETVKLIAEPWDCGPGGYQVGGFPPGWAEWNDQFRDTVRSFWKGDVAAAALAPRLCASPDLFKHRGRKPWASVNFVTSHDGFTLERSRDLQREAQRGERRREQRRHVGQPLVELRRRRPDRRSSDHRAPRQRQMRNMLATLLLSQGTPMLLAGDEMARTQQRQQQRVLPGQRDQLGELGRVRRASRASAPSCRRLTWLRHQYPILRRERFFSGEVHRRGRQSRTSPGSTRRAPRCAPRTGRTATCAASG